MPQQKVCRWLIYHVLNRCLLHFGVTFRCDGCPMIDLSRSWSWIFVKNLSAQHSWPVNRYCIKKPPSVKI
jgi:hypothetical protein